MRFEGSITSWNDERGFGFIAPDQGGQPVFVHVKAFGPRFGRPQTDRRITFEIELDRHGRKRACNVLPIRPAGARHPRRPGHPAQWGTASFLAIGAFLLVYLAVALVWHVPKGFAVTYLIASAVCFGAYAADKSAAVAGRRRISESTLLWLGLAGGWPGAIVAQQVLRHKSSKAAFRSAFWLSVAVNVVAFVAVNSPAAAPLRSWSNLHL